MTNSDTIGGRNKAKPDPLASDLRRMILGALEDAGGRDYLTKLAKESPSVFLGFVAKMIPSEPGGQDGGPSETPEIEAAGHPRPCLDGASRSRRAAR